MRRGMAIFAWQCLRKPSHQHANRSYKNREHRHKDVGLYPALENADVEVIAVVIVVFVGPFPAPIRGPVEDPVAVSYLEHVVSLRGMSVCDKIRDEETYLRG